MLYLLYQHLHQGERSSLEEPLTTYAPQPNSPDTANTPETIVLIQGYWMTPLCWQPWIERYVPIEKEWLLAKEVKN